MKKQYDFSKGERGKFNNKKAKVNLNSYYTRAYTKKTTISDK